MPLKGVILAGGLGTRLRPLTLVTNKHLLPVYDRPMIHHPIETLRAAGVFDVMVVTGSRHAGEFRRLLGDGRSLGLRSLRYAEQDGEGGIADALSHAETFADGERICVILGDNIIERDIADARRAYEAQSEGARILLSRVPDPQRFGVARLDGEQVVEIIEKPAVPPSDFAVIGVYFYDAAVFDLCRSLRPSARGELEITDVNNAYLRRGLLTASVLEGWWTDAGTIESLHHASRLVAKRARAA